ncbi:MAG TPA: hypothetical protein VJ797_15560 [Burkholderiales bacterium]|nr:hypothetical protein [Burkholderiales bacterium]
MYAERHTVTFVTATGGGATAYTPPVTGRIAAIRYIKATAAVALASTADFTITAAETGAAILSKANVAADFTNAPTQPAHTATGGVVTGVVRDVVVAGERVKVDVVAGGNTKQGTIHVVVG